MDATVSNRERARPWVIPAGLTLTAAIYALDLSLPLGVAGGVPYVAVVLLSLWSPNPRHTLIAAGVGSGLTVAGYVLSPAGGVPWMVVTNRLLAIVAIWVTALLTLRRKRDELALKEARDTLETRVAERTFDLAETGRALRASEERFRRAVVDAPIPIMIHAEDGEVVQINKAWTETTGFTHDEIPTIADWTERAYGQRRDAVRSIINKLYAIDQRVDDGEFRIGTKEGEQRVWNFFSAPLGLLPDGRRAAISMAVDITDRKRAEESLRRAHDELEQRVAERTAELLNANQKLKREIAEHEHTEAALRESEGRLRAVYQHQPAAAATWQHRKGDFVLVDFNRAAMAISRGRIAEHRGVTARQYYADRPDIVEDLQRCFDTKESISRETPFRIPTTGEQKEFSLTFAFAPPDLVMIHAVDITERKRAEIALRESEARLRAVLASTHDPMVTIDQAGIMQSASDSVRRVFGWEPGELVGKNVRILIPEPYRSNHDGYLAEYLRTGESRILSEPRELEAVRKDGSVFPCEISVWRVDLPGHDEPIFTGIMRDITERRQAEVALRESEAKYRQLMEQASDGIVIADARGNFLAANERACALLGYSPDEFSKLHVRDIIHPDDLEARPLEFYTIKPGRTILRERRYLRKDGSEFPVEISATRLPDGRLQGIIRDITERKQAEKALRESEERFRQLAENCREVFWLTTPHLREVLYVSPAYETVWGRPCQELYESPQAWLEALHPDDRERITRRLDVVPPADRGPREDEFRIVRPDGTIRWIRSRSAPICNERGEVYRIAGLSEDITDRKKAANERRQHREELAHVARLSTMGEMAAGIAHELNQPLAAIVNYVDAAMLTIGRGEADCEVLLADLEQAAGQAVRASTIIRRLRNLVRKQEPRSERVQVNDLAQEVLGLIDAEIRMAGVTLRLGLAERLPDVQADAIQIQQVLINLVRNGLDAMAETPRDRRCLILRSAQPEPDLVEVAVSDTGCGIDAEHGERVFEPFFTTKTDGMGMGLSINRSIIEAHGGRLWATRNTTGGMTFHLTLPIALGDESNGNRTDGVHRR